MYSSSQLPYKNDFQLITEYPVFHYSGYSSTHICWRDSTHSNIIPNVSGCLSVDGNIGLVSSCVMDSEMPYFLVWSLYSSRAWCIMRYNYVLCISWSCLLSFLLKFYIPFLINEIFHLLVIVVLTQALFLQNYYWMTFELTTVTEKVGNGKETMLLGFT